MAKVTYKSNSGEVRVLDVSPGTSVMEAAVKNSVSGIDGDCGGACACATCHVYVAEPWLGLLSAQSAMERSMLDLAENVQPGSRLACQINVTIALDGLLVETPVSQH